MRCRRGVALIVALALLTLAAALLAGTAAAGRAAQRSVQSHEAALLAGSEVRAAVAEFVAGWRWGDDSLAVGAERAAVIGPRLRGSGALPVTIRVRLLRLSAFRYIVVADCQAGPDDAVLARRRVRVILERAAPLDNSAPAMPPTPAGRWTVTDFD